MRPQRLRQAAVVTGALALLAAGAGMRLAHPSAERTELRPRLLRLPPGTFIMGDKWEDDNKPHAVTITRAFSLAESEVTQAQYEAVLGEDPSGFHGPELPVERVSFFDALRYCNRLSDMEGLPRCYDVQGEAVTFFGLACQGYRLPTEAEWEYAARADGKAEYAGSDDADRVAWFSDNAESKTHPVKQKAPNAWGLYDISGNVWEWAWDWYSSEGGGAVDPIGLKNEQESTGLRVVRGGSWINDAQGLRVASRFRNAPSNRANGIGFRPARSLP